MENQGTKKLVPNRLEDDIYSIKTTSKLTYLVVALVLMIFGFILHFPLKEIIKAQAAQIISSQKQCPISYANMEVSLFLPGVTLVSPILDRRCLNTPEPISLDEIEVSFWGPSFSPPGVRFAVDLKKESETFELYYSQSIGKSAVKIPETILRGKTISDLVGEKIRLGGDIQMEGVVHLKGQSIQEGGLLVSSKNLVIPSQNLQGLALPNMNINTFLLKLKIDKPQEAVVESLTIGEKGSPIRGEIKGSIKLNSARIELSQLNLDGKIQFSPVFLEQFGVIKLLLASKKPDKGFYKFQIKGSPSRPQADFQ